jgi:hypothetical protein
MVITAIKADLNDQRLAEFQRSALTMHQEISIPVRGEYTIRTAIHDLNANHLGAFEVPVAALKDLPILSSQSSATASSPANSPR